MHDRLVSRRIDALHQCFLVCFCYAREQTRVCIHSHPCMNNTCPCLLLACLDCGTNNNKTNVTCETTDAQVKQNRLVTISRKTRGWVGMGGGTKPRLYQVLGTSSFL